jgi:RimJ/RimL family protein N-acetyltransferase
LKLVLGRDLEVGLWAQSRIPHLFLDQLGPYVGFGIVDAAGVLRGAALFHGYAPLYRGIEISFALESPRYLSRAVILGILAYPFIQLNCVRVTAATPGSRSAASARRFLETFGFKREGLARLGFGDFGHAVIYGLTRKDWSASRFGPERALNVEKGILAAASA